MKKKIIKFLFLACIFSIPAWGEVVERIVAIVGSEVITLYDLDVAMTPYAGEIKKAQNRDEKFKTVRAEVLERLINYLLLKQTIESSKITASSDDVARAIRNIITQNHITIDVLKTELAAKGISYDSYKEEVRKGIQRMKFVNQEIGSRVKISDQDMRDYYNKHMDEFGVHQSAHIAQIVLPFDETTNKEKALALKTKAEEIVRQVRAGESFSSLAKEYSKGPNAEGGGDLGIVNPDNLLPEIALVLKDIKIGQISNPIVSPAGIHIINLIDRARATEMDFERLKDRVYEKMYDQRMMEELNQYLAELRKKTYVEIKDVEK